MAISIDEVGTSTGVDLNYEPVIQQTNNPPGGPATGDRYLVGTVPTGAWVGNANRIAEWDGAVWQYTIPTTGYKVNVLSVGVTKRFNGVAWVNWPGTSILQNGNSLGVAMTIGTNDNNHWNLKTNNVIRARMSNAGVFNQAGNSYFGHISTAPGARVHIQGADDLITGYTVRCRSNTVIDTFFVRNDGMVSAKSGYSINGNLAFHVSTVQQNIAIGYTLFNVATAGATNNISLGGRVMTIITTGDENIGAGVDTLFNLTTGSYNIFIGGSGGAAIVGGSKNGGFGWNTLSSLVGGDENTVAGHQAGRGITSGNRTVCIGTDTYGGGTGSDSTHVGYASGNSTGNYSRATAIGSAANQFCVAPYSECIAIGYRATNTASNQWVVGQDNCKIYDAYFGQGYEVDPTSLRDFRLGVTNSVSGSAPYADKSAAAGTFTITGAQGTGTGVGGDIIFKVAPAGGAGNALNALVEVLRLKGTSVINLAAIQTGNAGLVSGDLYVDTAANILANADLILARKV